MENQHRPCNILSAMPLGEEEKKLLRGGAAYLIAADSGYVQALGLGLVPDVIVGDFDSAPLPGQGGEIICLPAEKDDTDTAYAVKLAIERGFRRVSLFGAWGNRPDHSLANLQLLLYMAQRNVENRLLCPWGSIRCLGPGRYSLAPVKGHCFSLLAAGGPVEGVCLSHVKYPLRQARLTPDSPLGVSNEFTGENAAITIGGGFAYLFVVKQE